MSRLPCLIALRWFAWLLIVAAGLAMTPPVGAADDAPEPALQFDGIDDYVVVPDLKYDGSGPLTIEVRAMPIGPDDRTQRFIVTNGDYVEKSEQGFSIYQRGDRYPSPRFTSWAFGYSGKGDIRGSLTARKEDWQPGKFSQIAVVIDQQRWKFYVDGQLWRRGELGSEPSDSDQPFYIGRHPVFGGFFRGHVAELRISSVARTEKQLFTGKEAESDKHTLALYRFDEGGGIVLKDRSGNDHHGDIVGASWVGQKPKTHEDR